MALPVSLLAGGFIGYQMARPKIAAAVFDARNFERASASKKTLEALQICSDAARASADVAKLMKDNRP